MNLFKYYEPLKPDQKKKAKLARKMTRTQSQSKVKRGAPLLYRIGVVAAALLIFTVGISFLPKNTDNTDNTAETPERSEDPTVYTRTMTFTGQSEHWKAIHEVYIKTRFAANQDSHSFETFNDGVFKLIYIGEESVDKKSNFSYEIKGVRRGAGKTGSVFPVDGMFTAHEVFASDKDDTIKVTVRWGTHAESFTMKLKPGSFVKNEYDYTTPISDVEDYKNLIGIAGGEPFQIASISSNWSELNQALSMFFGDIPSDKEIPALMAATGNELSQTVFYMLPKGTDTDKVMIVGQHSSGKELLFYEGNRNTAVAKGLFGEGVVIPAKVDFKKQGIWHITAYEGKETIGKVTVEVYNKPDAGKGTKPRFTEGAFVKAFSKIKGNWLQKDHPVLTIDAKNPELTIGVRKQRIRKTAESFPITVVGFSADGNESFVKTFKRDEAQNAKTFYQIDAAFPLTQGKWELLIFAKDFIVGEYVFKVNVK